MPIIKFDREYNVDVNGYLLDPSQWAEDFARGMAPRLKITNGLTEDHWRVIYFIRNNFEKMNQCPLVYIACRQNAIGLGDLKKLFPTGYHRGACKLAGISYRDISIQRLRFRENMVHHTRLYKRKIYACDAQGFLVNFEDWDENFALNKAYELKMSDYLTEAHWNVIYSLRRHFQESGEIPNIYKACEDNDLTLDDLEKLFPSGYHRGALKIAGLHV